MLENHDKTYVAEFVLGVKTDTQDRTGQVLDRRPVTAVKEEIIAAVNGFSGEIRQIPPMYSAVQVNGKRLYDLARRGVEIERAPRTVTIYSIRVLSVEKERCRIEVSCSKGTYIRTLCSDIGDKLGCYATLTSLQRTAASGFTLDCCHTLEEVEKYREDGSIQDRLTAVERVFSFLPKLSLSGEQTGRFLNGVKLEGNCLPIDSGHARFAVYSSGGDFLGTAVLEPETQKLKIEKLFLERK